MLGLNIENLNIFDETQAASNSFSKVESLENSWSFLPSCLPFSLHRLNSRHLWSTNLRSWSIRFDLQSAGQTLLSASSIHVWVPEPENGNFEVKNEILATKFEKGALYTTKNLWFSFQTSCLFAKVFLLLYTFLQNPWPSARFLNKAFLSN